jgi:hypothetical protein
MLKYIFIIPYRDRENQKQLYTIYMKYLLEDYKEEEYKILFVHQKNNLPFNRGGIKNCGFLYIKETYPEDYKNFIFIFNDIDTLPYKKNVLDYNTTKGIVKHFYGFNFALGGLFSITGEDFETINGFPSLWYWGWEDSVIYKRCLSHNIKVDRSVFFTFGNKNILHLVDDLKKIYSKNTVDNYKNNSIVDGFKELKEVTYLLNNNDPNILDVTHFKSVHPINDSTITQFNVGRYNKFVGTKKERKKSLLFL